MGIPFRIDDFRGGSRRSYERDGLRPTQSLLPDVSEAAL
jgi:hypothetical protein